MSLSARILLAFVASTLIVCQPSWVSYADEADRYGLGFEDDMYGSYGEDFYPADEEAPAEEPSDQASTIEVVIERYPDRNVKVQREVTLDLDGNYVNQGTYSMYDRSGKTVRSGEYRMGKQNGEWMQIFQAGQGQLFSGNLDKEYSGPFVSSAKFLDGQLHGTWTINTLSGKKIIEWNFQDGLRHGLATWWYPNGAKRWELAYEDGTPVGERSDWGPDGQLIGTREYVDGRPLVNKIKWYTKGVKEYEGTVLDNDDFDRGEFDWWTTSPIADPASVTVPVVKHGSWTAWYPNGGTRAEGIYDRDLPAGKFAWWYENGQKQAEGTYQKGQKVGIWTTWHANGMKESLGEYSDDVHMGEWRRWQPDGRLTEMRDYNADAAAGIAIEMPEPSEQEVGGETTEADEVQRVAERPEI